MVAEVVIAIVIAVSISKTSQLVMVVVGKQKAADLDALSMHCGSHHSVAGAVGTEDLSWKVG
jgi:hypothetical protein